MSESLKTVIVVRRDLELPVGKWIAQSVHAAMRTLNTETLTTIALSELYEHIKPPICIVCYVNSEAQLINLHEKAKSSGVPCGLQRDAGHNFVEPGTITVLCIGPAPQSKIDPITKKLQLLK